MKNHKYIIETNTDLLRKLNTRSFSQEYLTLSSVKDHKKSELTMVLTSVYNIFVYFFL